MTPLAKFALIILLVGGSAYFIAPYIQAYTNPDAEPVKNPLQNLIPSAKSQNKYVIYLDGFDDSGTIALRNRMLSNKEYRKLSKGSKLDKETYVQTLEVGEVVTLIQEHSNAYEVKTKAGKTGYIPNAYRGVRTLIQLKE